MFSDPKRNLDQFGLMPGMKVADLGSGSGFYTIEAARLVGDKGRVFSVDIQKELLERTKKNAHHEGLHNVEVIWGDLEKVGGTRLQDGSTDAIIISNILFQVEKKDTFFQEVRRILKPKRMALLIDWADSSDGIGPAAQDIITENAAKQLFSQHGFTFVKNVNAGEHHYGLVFEKTS